MKNIYIYFNNSKNSYPEYQIPIHREPHDNTQDVEFVELLFQNSNVEYWRGWSNCRICGKMNGSKEYCFTFKDTNYYIPEGYLHYVKDHYIELAPELQELFNQTKQGN